MGDVIQRLHGWFRGFRHHDQPHQRDIERHHRGRRPVHVRRGCLHHYRRGYGQFDRGGGGDVLAGNGYRCRNGRSHYRGHDLHAQRPVPPLRHVSTPQLNQPN